MLVNGRELDRPAPPLEELLARGLAADPEATAVISAEDELSWRELDDRAATLAAAYIGLGLERGERIASLMPNRTALLVHYLACFRAALVATPLNYRYTAREIDHALSVGGAAAIVAHDERRGDLAESELAGGLRLGTIRYGGAEPGGTRLEDLMSGERPASEPVAASPGDPAAIFFTSGSTGPAKGVTHTHETLRWMMASAVDAFGLTAGDVFLPGSSMSHIGSFLWSLTTLSVGGEVVIARTFDSHEILPLLRARRPTILAMIPAALAALIRDHDLDPEDFESLRICRAGADKVSTELLREFAAAAGFPIDEGYGMTEVGLATLNPPA